MNSNNLHEHLNRALTTNNVVLLNGPWGCGKTYQIKKFVDVNAQDLDIVYISLFGINSYTDLVNTICAKVAPLKYYGEKAGLFLLNTISNVTLSTESENVSKSLSFALNIQENNKSIGLSRSERKIIVFDDLERMSFDKIPIIDVLGVFENLIYQGFKVVIVANINEIENKKEFDRFYEKVIDKRIDIQDIDHDVIDNYFTEDEDLDFTYLKEKCNSNIRTIQRVSNLYHELLSTLNEMGIDNNVYSNQMILDVCSDLIVGLFSNVFVNKYKEDKKNKQDDKIDWEFISIPNFDDYDEDLKEKLEAICYAANYGFNEPKINLLRALLSFHTNGEKDKLKDVFHADGSVLDNYFNLYTDNELEDLFRKQLEYILVEENESVTKILNTLEPIFRVSNDELINEYREKLKNHILTNRSRFKENLDEYPLRLLSENKKYQDFINEIREQFKTDEITALLDDLNNHYDNGDYEKCTVIIRKLYSGANDFNEKLKSKVIDYFKSKNYLFEYVDKHMPNNEYWMMLQSAKKLYERIEFIADSKNYLSNLIDADKNNQTLQRRFEYLYGEKYE